MGWGVPPGEAPRVLRLSPGVVAAVLAAAAATLFGTPVVDVVRFGGAVIWSVLLPGVLVLRVLRERPAQLVTELALGGVVGLAVQLLAWAAYVGMGIGSWLATYPLVLLGACLLLPSRRRVLSMARYPETLHAAPAWAVAAVYAASVGQLALSTFRAEPLPPASGLWYQDLYWHLSIAAEARHAVPPKVPQLGDEVLRYHWFSNAHMAAESLVSGVDVLLVTARLFYLPVYALVALTTFALTLHLSGRAWAGAGAAAMLVLPAWVQAAPWFGGVAQQAYINGSPSQLYCLPFIVVGSWLLGDAARGRAGPRGWLLLGLVVVGASGAKSSALPVLLGGAGAAVVAALVARSGRRRAIAGFGLVGAVLAASVNHVAASSTGSRLGVAALERGVALVRQQVHRGVTQSTMHWVVAAVFLFVLVQFLYLALGLGLLHRDSRRDAAVWVLVGALLSAQAAMLLISHPSQSQAYFVRGILPLAAVFTMCGLAVLVERAAGVWPGWALLVVGAGAAVLGVVLVLVVHRVAGSSTPPPGQALSVVARLAGLWLVVSLLVLAVVAMAVLAPRSRSAQLAAFGVALAVLAVATVPALWANPLRHWSGYRHPAVFAPGQQLSAGEVAATTWMREHAPQGDLMATNVYCLPTPTTPHCDARAYWVTGLSEHSAFLAGWAYEDENSLNITHDSSTAYRRGFWDPTRLALNDAAFTAPSAVGLDTLYRRGVRWLFADSAASPVAPALESLADRRFSAGQVTIYRLRGPSR